MKKKLRIIIILSLCALYLPAALLLGACTHGDTEPNWQVQAEFEVFLNEMFAKEVSGDALTLHYLLANPENFGIHPEVMDFEDYSVEAKSQAAAEAENYLQGLSAFPYKELDSENQLIYDMLKRELETELALSGYLYYEEILGPSSGVQAQLPILLAEYAFYDKQDIKNYLILLNSLDDYFVQIGEFEKEKSAAGLFMSDTAADSIVSQCLAFIQNPEEHYLLACFEDRLEPMSGLTEEEKTEFQTQNKDIVMNCVIPAYEQLVSILRSLKGTGQNDAGLYGLKDGKDYYELLIKDRTGSTKGIPELKNMLVSALTNNLRLLAQIAADTPDIYEQYETMQFPESSPSESLFYLSQAIQADFPPVLNANCDIRYIHESLQDYLSPAMYLVPPIDDFTHNYIYINASPANDLGILFPTIAHEGYPGHLYQNVYFRSSNPKPIRSLLDVTGYSEGWATYAELYSYDLAGLSDELAAFLQANVLATHCLYSLTDIGIHYEGWQLPDAVNFLADYGFDETESERIYLAMIAEPGMYLPYSVGCLEILNLRQIAIDELGDKFNMQEFHTFLLDFGPAPFDLIENGMEEWMEKVQREAAVSTN